MILNSNNETLLYFIMFRFIPLFSINPNGVLEKLNKSLGIQLKQVRFFFFRAIKFVGVFK
jgi:hypothetical protein